MKYTFSFVLTAVFASCSNPSDSLDEKVKTGLKYWVAENANNPTSYEFVKLVRTDSLTLDKAYKNDIDPRIDPDVKLDKLAIDLANPPDSTYDIDDVSYESRLKNLKARLAYDSILRLSYAQRFVGFKYEYKCRLDDINGKSVLHQFEVITSPSGEIRYVTEDERKGI